MVGVGCYVRKGIYWGGWFVFWELGRMYDRSVADAKFAEFWLGGRMSVGSEPRKRLFPQPVRTHHASTTNVVSTESNSSFRLRRRDYP